MTQANKKPRRRPSDDVAAISRITRSLEESRIALLSPRDVAECLDLAIRLKLTPKVVILDPWYNKGHGGAREDYVSFVVGLLEKSADLGEHIFLWGFPEIIARFIDKIPKSLNLVCWLTWYYKNNPSVIRGWRSSQHACLHLAKSGARLYPEHFLNERQKDLQLRGKLRYMPGPTSVIEEPLIVGFIGKKERTGHPAQKPEAVFERLILMTTIPGDLVFDPMCGSGTTGAVAQKHNRGSVLSDCSAEYVEMCEKRLGVRRLTRI